MTSTNFNIVSNEMVEIRRLLEQCLKQLQEPNEEKDFLVEENKSLKEELAQKDQLIKKLQEQLSINTEHRSTKVSDIEEEKTIEESEEDSRNTGPSLYFSPMVPEL